MNKQKTERLASIVILLAGVMSVILALVKPSESESAVFLGYSKERLILISAQMILLAGMALLITFLNRQGTSSKLIAGLLKVIQNPQNASTIRNLLLGLAVFLSFAFLCVSIFVPQVLSPIMGWFTCIAWIAYSLYVRFYYPSAGVTDSEKVSFLPSVRNLNQKQKRVALVLLVIGLAYFLLFIPENLRHSANLNDFSLDEMVQYPVVMKMLTPQESVRMTLYKFFAYGEYIYGFPFYGLSALLLLPVKLACQADFQAQTQVNMLILRQLVSVLPVIVSIYLLTFLATSFEKWWKSIGLFLLMLTIPGVIWYNSGFWHPDGINFLFIVLALYFLDRDQMRFGGNFFAAAAAIGLSVATRLFGLFFFLAIAGLLVAGLIKKILTLRQAVAKGVIFIVLMAGTILVANPFLFNPGEFGAMIKTYQRQQVQVSEGVNEPDPEGVYRTGLDAWLPIMQRNYGSGVTLGLLGVSVLAGLLGGKHRHFYRILFAWVVVLLSFLVFFVKMKSFWYLMPAMIPLYCWLFSIPEAISDWIKRTTISSGLKTAVLMSSYLLVSAVGGYQLYLNIRMIVS